MSADFNNPTVDDQYTEILPQIRDNQAANAVMFNNVVATNIPINAVQFVSGQFNIWDGGAWNVQSVVISGGGTGATNAADARSNLDVPSTSEAALNEDNLNNLTDKPTAFNNIKQAATVDDTGVVEKATPTEMTNGDADKYPDCEVVKGYVDNSAIYYNSEILAAPFGDFTSGSCTVVRIGDVVTISGYFGFASSAFPSSGNNFLPSWAEPLDTLAGWLNNGYLTTASLTYLVRVTEALGLNFVFESNKTDTSGFTISYIAEPIP